VIHSTEMQENVAVISEGNNNGATFPVKGLNSHIQMPGGSVSRRITSSPSNTHSCAAVLCCFKKR
jgi:hypothetical protein